MEKLKLWKDNMENNGLHVSMRKTKVMVCGKGLDTIKPSGKFSVVYVERSQRRNPIFCTRCDNGFIRTIQTNHLNWFNHVCCSDS